MISTVNAFRPSLLPRAATTSPQAPAEQPPSVDFATLDTPEKVAMLPCLNPGLIAVAATASLMSSMIPGPVTAAVQLSFNEVQGSLTYSVDPNNQEQPLTVSGTLGGVEYHETWKMNQEKRTLTIDGALGDQPLHVEVAAGQKGAMLKGEVGSMKVLQMLTGDGFLEHVQANGKLGDLAFNNAMNLTKEDNGRTYNLQVDGRLGQASLTQDLSIKAQGESDDISFAGHGNLAGVDYKMSGQLAAARS